MQFPKLIAVLSLALTATALPVVEELVTRQGTVGGSNTGTAQTCGQKGGYLACCSSAQTTDRQSIVNTIGAVTGLLPIVFSLLLPAEAKTAATCNAILSGQIINCEQTQTCCFNGPTTQNNGNSLISLFNNNQMVFCPTFKLPINLPVA